MRNPVSGTFVAAGRLRPTRRGAVAVLAAAMLIMIFGFTAFSVDVGYITLTKTQLQRAADASVLAAAQELADGLGTWAPLTEGEAAAAARDAAVTLAGAHRGGDRESIHADGQRDVRLGNVQWNPVTGTWQKTWDVPPYNLVEVTLRRNGQFSGADGPLPLFFAPVIGHKTADVSARATAAIVPASGFRVRAGGGYRAGAMPFAVDKETWDDLIYNNIGISDAFRYDPVSGEVTPGSDGVLEIDLYPHAIGDLPPGNRGTVNIGTANNSTNTVIEQILYGLTAEHLAFHGGELRTDQGPLYLGGNTGISAAVKDALEAVKGKPRAIPVFVEVKNPGNNAIYTIVDFVGVRVVDVKLEGNPKHVLVQPALLVDSAAIPDKSGAPFEEHSVFTQPLLIE